MLLTITTRIEPATDLGYLLHKNPSRVQSFALNFGTAHVFYPEADAACCTLALLLDIDPISLSRRGSAANRPLQPYINDRPYVASSFLSVAIAQVLGTALAGRCLQRPELAEARIPLEAALAVVPCRGGEVVLRRLFEPLGYTVQATRHVLDSKHPEWEPSSLFAVELRAVVRLRELLAHLYVLMPVLDDEKHYWVGEDEVNKLLRHGEGWLATHPERELITQRFLKHRRSLVQDALERLADEAPASADPDSSAAARSEETLEGPLSLDEQRLGAVVAALKGQEARHVLDLGCGDGKLLQLLFADRAFERIVGVDVSQRALEIAAERLHLAQLPEAQRRRIELWQGSLVYRDKRFAGFDAATLVEVIEHLEPSRLSAFERVLFQHARPESVVLTTPNAEYNVRFESLPAGGFRHHDHRFEWTRAQFEAWAKATAETYGYAVRFLPVGSVDLEVGAPTQLAIFCRRDQGAEPRERA
jgi:3' terminal RNA ribose 2'-O-methyltransferase Hen1